MSFTDPNIVDTEPDPMSDAVPNTGAPEDADGGLATDVNVDSTPEEPDLTPSDSPRDETVDREVGA